MDFTLLLLLMLLPYFLILNIIIHETIHIIQLKRDGYAINDVCFIGFSKENSFLNSTFGYVEGEGKQVRYDYEKQATILSLIITIIIIAVYIYVIFEIEIRAKEQIIRELAVQRQ